MLNAKDLRSGNWVLQVSGTDRDSTNFFEYKSINPEEYLFSTARVCFPIRLSPDILGKAGFKHDFGDWYKNLNAQEAEGSAPLLSFKKKENSWYFRDARIPAKTEYLHQLQNLVYALSNTELEVQLGHFENLPVLHKPILTEIRKTPLKMVPAYTPVFSKESIL